MNTYHLHLSSTSIRQPLATPVALIIFNRADTTERVFETLRRVHPVKLLVIADGPRSYRSGDREAVAAARAVIDRIDWDCDILKNYADDNLGCGRRLMTGLNWLFAQVEDAIILEDDCIPHPSFFRFCEELLEKYRHDARVMHICGSQLLSRPPHSPYSYSFSKYTSPWGWACWRRAWQHYDYQMQALPDLLKEGWLDRLFPDRRASQYWADLFQPIYDSDKIQDWDRQWQFSCWQQEGLAIRPSKNLVSNIGFGPRATHTRDATRNPLPPIAAMPFPLSHPPQVIQDKRHDQRFQQKLLAEASSGIVARAQRKFKRMLRMT